MYKMKKTQILFTALIVLFGMNNANAALATFSLTGNVESAEAGGIYNLAIGDTITATGSFDDSLLAGGFGGITNLLITAGDLTFNNSMEVFGGGEISFNPDGTLFALTYEANEGQLGSSADFDSFFTIFTGLTTSPNKVQGSYATYTISGQWDVASFAVTTVPVPAAAWLLGSGLIALVGCARRRSA